MKYIQVKSQYYAMFRIKKQLLLIKVHRNTIDTFHYSVRWNVTCNISILQLYINWMNFFINLLLPLLIMFVLNLGIYRVLKNLWAAHRTCCMNHRNRQNLITSLNQRGRRASMGGKLKKSSFSCCFIQYLFYHRYCL